MRIELEIFGPIPTVKDSYRAIVTKRKPTIKSAAADSKSANSKEDLVAKLVKDRRLNAKLNYIIEQIPPEVFDSGLLHPRITMQRFAPPEYFVAEQGRSLSDRDGCFSTLLDLFVRTGILRGSDSDRVNNGEWIIKPTIRSIAHRVLIILETDD